MAKLNAWKENPQKHIDEILIIRNVVTSELQIEARADLIIKAALEIEDIGSHKVTVEPNCTLTVVQRIERAVTALEKYATVRCEALTCKDMKPFENMVSNPDAWMRSKEIAWASNWVRPKSADATTNSAKDGIEGGAWRRRFEQGILTGVGAELKQRNAEGADLVGGSTKRPMPPIGAQKSAKRRKLATGPELLKDRQALEQGAQYLGPADQHELSVGYGSLQEQPPLSDLQNSFHDYRNMFHDQPDMLHGQPGMLQDQLGMLQSGPDMSQSQPNSFKDQLDFWGPQTIPFQQDQDQTFAGTNDFFQHQPHVTPGQQTAIEGQLNSSRFLQSLQEQYGHVQTVNEQYPFYEGLGVSEPSRIPREGDIGMPGEQDTGGVGEIDFSMAMSNEAFNQMMLDYVELEPAAFAEKHPFNLT